MFVKYKLMFNDKILSYLVGDIENMQHESDEILYKGDVVKKAVDFAE